MSTDGKGRATDKDFEINSLLQRFDDDKKIQLLITSMTSIQLTINLECYATFLF